MVAGEMAYVVDINRHEIRTTCRPTEYPLTLVPKQDKNSYGVSHAGSTQNVEKLMLEIGYSISLSQSWQVAAKVPEADRQERANIIRVVRASGVN